MPAMASRQAPRAASAPPDAAQAEAAVRVLRQFRLVFNTVKTHFQQVEKRAGLGGAQVWALSVIRDRAGIGVNELARALDVRQPTASNLVKSLVEQELVEVRRDERDRRAVMLFVRPAGQRVLRKAPGPFAGVLPEALASLDPRTLRRLEQDLSVLIEVLGADERGLLDESRPHVGEGHPQREQSGPAASVLTVTADKEEYKVGETATIQLPESAQGRALVTIENGTGIVDSRWISRIMKPDSCRLELVSIR